MAAPNFATALQNAKDELATDVTTVDSKTVTWEIGKIYQNWEVCPCGSVWLGDEVAEVAQTGREYRSFVELHVLLATYTVDPGDEENVYANAHQQMTEFRKKVVDSLHSNRTLGSTVDQLTFQEIRVEPPEAVPDEDLQLCRVTFRLAKKWAE